MGNQEGAYAGIDVSKESLDLAVHDERQQWHFTNDPAGIRHVITLLRKHKPATVCFEATGGYEVSLSASRDDQRGKEPPQERQKRIS
jgi:transposase